MGSKINKVPYYSQFKDVENESFKPNGEGKVCTATCIKMALEYFNGNAPTIDELYSEAVMVQKDMLKRNLLTNESTVYGIPQDIYVFLAHNHGLPAYREEFKSVQRNLKSGEIIENNKNTEFFLNLGISKIKSVIGKGGLVIASVVPHFSSNRLFHTVLLIGIEEEKGGFYYHNPDDREKSGENQFISYRDFEEAWRKLAIFFEK